jgi:glutaredoxin
MNNMARMALWAFGLLLCSTTAPAASDKVYKTLDADGRVVYSQSPSTASNGVPTGTVMEFNHLPASPLSAQTLKFLADMEKSIAGKAAAGYAPPVSNTIVLFSARWCGYCKLAKAYLQKGGYAYQELDIDTPEGMRSFAQVRPKSGIPVLFKDGKRTNGFTPQAYDKLFKASK